MTGFDAMQLGKVHGWPSKGQTSEHETRAGLLGDNAAHELNTALKPAVQT